MILVDGFSGWSHDLRVMFMSEPQGLKEEVKLVKKVLTPNGYKKCSFQIPKRKVREEDLQIEVPTANKWLICIPYIAGVLEQLQRVFRSHSIYHLTTNLSTP